jgi:hypothetical protein
LDIVALVGYLKLHHHQTVDEVHQSVNERLKDYQMSLSRRNVTYLFEAYGALLKAASQNKSDPALQDWLGQVRFNGGFLISIDGIQPDKGNETIYLIREVITGRLLHAQNVRTSDTETQSMAHFDSFEQAGLDEQTLLTRLAAVDHHIWRDSRDHHRSIQSDRLNVFRFRHKPESYLQQ